MQYFRIIPQRGTESSITSRRRGRIGSLLLGFTLLAPTGPAAGDGIALKKIPPEAIVSVTAEPTSTDRDAESGQSLYRPRHLLDGHRWSAWCGSAAQGSPNRGVGQRLRFELQGIHHLTQLEVHNGDQRSPRTQQEGVQTRILLLRTERGEQRFALLPGGVEPQLLTLAAPTSTRWLELEVAEVHPGGLRGPCFSEITLYEPRDLLAQQPELLEEIRQLVARLGQPDEALVLRRLADLGSVATPWLLPLLERAVPEQQVKIINLLGEFGDPQVAAALEQQYVRTRERTVQLAVLTALTRLKPSSSTPFLLEQSRQPDPELARAALLALEGSGDERTLQPFLRLLLQGDEETARLAIRHLAGFGSKAYALLAPHLNDPNLGARERAVWAVGRIDTPQARQALTRALQSGTGRIVVAGLRGLGEQPREENFQIIMANLHHQEVLVREGVADALGGFIGNPQAVAALGELVTDPEPAVRSRAYGSLIRLGPDAEPQLLDRVRNLEGPQLDEALEAIARLPQPSGARVQAELLGDRRERVQQRMLALLESRGAEGLAALVHAMGHSDPQVRFTATRRVLELGEAGLPILLRTATADAPPEVRAACFKAVGHLASPLAREVVAQGLTDPARQVRREALAAARRIPWTGYASHIPALLLREQGEGHLLAVEVAGESRLREAVPVLMQQLDEGHPDSIRIIWALGRIGDPAALATLAARARSRETFTRQVAVDALGGIRSEDALGLLMDAMLDPDPMVRQAAKQALLAEE